MGGLGRALVVAPLLLGASGCGSGLNPDAVARAGEFQLGTEAAASFLAPVSALPNDPAVAEATVNIWIDYVLLAWAVNRGEVDGLDLDMILEDASDRQLVDRLREQMIQLDTTITDEELEAAFDLQRPGEEVRARHILFAAQAGLPASRLDSIRTLAEAVRARALAGEDFGRLAEEFSDDRGSAVAGGDLGFFGRGEMVPPFEEAAFALEPGEISGVVESDFGLHVIRVEDRRFPALSSIAEDYRTQLQRERIMVAESTYLADLEGRANMQVDPVAVALVRRIAEDPGVTLSGNEAAEVLVRWTGGEYTAEAFREFIEGQPEEVLAQITAAPDVQIEALLGDLGRDRLLVNEAGELGIRLSAEDRTELRAGVVGEYRMIAGLLGVDSLEAAGGTSLATTVEAAALELMRRVVASEQDLIPLGNLAVPLRDRYGYEVADDAALRIVNRVNELRGPGAEAGLGEPGVPPEGAGPPSQP